MFYRLFVSLIILFSCIFSSYSQIYRYIDMKDGLSSRRVLSIRQSSQGYMWILTHKGIDRFDGKNFKHYQLKKEDRIINFYPNLNQLAMDGDNTLWEIGKDGYVFRYDEMKDAFHIVFDMKNKYPQYKDIPISAFHTDGKERVLMCCGNDIIYYNTKNDSSYCINNVSDSKIAHITGTADENRYFIAGKSEIYTLSLFGDGEFKTERTDIKKIGLIDFMFYHKESGYLIINTLVNGLYLYNPAERSVYNVGNVLTDISINAIRTYGSSNNEVLIATDGGGVYKMDVKNKIFTHFLEEDHMRKNGMNGSIIKDLCIDRDGRIWNVIYPTGITVYTDKYQPYTWIRHSEGNGNSLVDNRINAILTDSEGDVWYATSNGISCYRRSAKTWKNFLSAYTNDTGNDNHIFTSLCEYKPGVILAGGYMSGIYRIDKHSGKSDYAIQLEGGRDEASDKYIRSIIRDSYGILWGGGFQSLRSYDEKTGRTNIYPSNYPITCVREKDAKSLWVGTINGLYIFSKEDNDMERFGTWQGTGCVNSIYQTKDNIYTYVGTYGDGLYIINNETGEVEHFTISNCSLITNNIYSISENRHGDIILGTENGISLYDRKDEIFTNWTGEQGLSASNFNQGAATNTGRGEIILGSNEGAIILPDDIKLPRQFSSHMILDNLNIMYRPVYPGEKGSPLERLLNETSVLELGYYQNTFSMNVSSVNYDNPSNIYYSWKLEGFFDEWSEPDSDGTIKYTNLSPGRYNLKIRAILLDNNQLLEERSLEIIIGRPLWLTYWAIMLYILFVLGAAYSLYRYKMIKKDRRTSQEKINFFIHTAHDIRTPLTLIKAPLGEILKNEKLSPEGTANINLALQNTDNLSELANKLMNFQKEELYSSHASVTRMELNTYIKGYLEQFRNYATQQGITMEFSSGFDSLDVWIDRNKMDSILRNLISNALKYTPKGGKVEIYTSNNKKCWTIDIADTGIGMSKTDSKKLFKYMFRGYNATNQLITGSGIGMLLTWRLIRNHEGRISFTSVENSGTCFHLSFPIRSHKYIYKEETPAEKSDNMSQDEWAYTIPADDYNADEPEDIKSGHNVPVNAPRILIVEDNPALRNFLMQSLSETYNTSGVENGKEALDVIKISQPDLIISDVMMPQMNGHELCKAVKGNMATSHIPFIMLTALGDKKDIITGLKTKADLYIVKPFDMTVLKANISNVLENRDLVRKRLQQFIDSLPQHSVILGNSESDEKSENEVADIMSGLDEEFINKVTQLIKDGLGKGLNVDTLCAEVNMSRTSFYNKIKALTGEPPADLIRKIRMQEAAILLRTQKYTVSEVSDMLGFADPKYFTDTFKKAYGVPPRDYMKGISDNNK